MAAIGVGAIAFEMAQLVLPVGLAITASAVGASFGRQLRDLWNNMLYGKDPSFLNKPSMIRRDPTAPDTRLVPGAAGGPGGGFPSDINTGGTVWLSAVPAWTTTSPVNRASVVQISVQTSRYEFYLQRTPQESTIKSFDFWMVFVLPRSSPNYDPVGQYAALYNTYKLWGESASLHSYNEISKTLTSEEKQDVIRLLGRMPADMDALENGKWTVVIHSESQRTSQEEWKTFFDEHPHTSTGQSVGQAIYNDILKVPFLELIGTPFWQWYNQEHQTASVAHGADVIRQTVANATGVNESQVSTNMVLEFLSSLARGDEDAIKAAQYGQLIVAGASVPFFGPAVAMSWFTIWVGSEMGYMTTLNATQLQAYNPVNKIFDILGYGTNKTIESGAQFGSQTVNKLADEGEKAWERLTPSGKLLVVGAGGLGVVYLAGSFVGPGLKFASQRRSERKAAAKKTKKKESEKK